MTAIFVQLWLSLTYVTRMIMQMWLYVKYENRISDDIDFCMCCYVNPISCTMWQM